MTTVPHPVFNGNDLLAEVKANAAKLSSCAKHLMPLGEPPYKFGMHVECEKCGGSMKAVDLFRYLQGYIAAGGNPNEVSPGYWPDWKPSKPSAIALARRIATVYDLPHDAMDYATALMETPDENLLLDSK